MARIKGEASGGVKEFFLSWTTLHFDRAPRDRGATFFFLAVAFSAYAIFLQFSGISIGRWGVDAAAHQFAIENEGRGATSAADKVVANVLPYIGVGDYYGLLPTVAIVLMLSYLCMRARISDLVIVLFLTVSTIFQLQFPSKEIIINLSWFLIFIFFIIIKSSFSRALFAFSLIFSLGMVFRKYYIITAAFAVLLYMASSYRAGLARVSVALASVSLIPPVSGPLLSAKYLVFRNISAAAASKIPLAMTGLSPLAFISNYMVSLIYFVFPILLGPRIQVFYMQIFSIIIVRASLKALEKGERVSASIFVALILTLPIFVSEVGTYARHVGAALPLLLMSIGLGRGAEARRPAVPAGDFGARSKSNGGRAMVPRT